MLAPCLLPALHLLQPERPQGRGRPCPHLAAPHLRQFHRRSADVANDTPGIGPAQQHALRRKPRLLVAIDHPGAQAGFPQHLVAEGPPVGGLAHGGGRDHGQRRHVHPLGQKRESPQRRQRAVASARVEPPGFGQAKAQTAHDLFVVEIGRGPGRAIKNHQPDRVRADIHNADPAERAGRRIVEQRLCKGAVIVGRRLVSVVHSGLAGCGQTMPPRAGRVNLAGGAGNRSVRNQMGLTRPFGGSQAAGRGTVQPGVPIRGASDRHFPMSVKVGPKRASAYVLILSQTALDGGATPGRKLCGNQSRKGAEKGPPHGLPERKARNPCLCAPLAF